MRDPALSIRLNETRLRSAISEFVRRNAPEAVDRIVRKAAFDVVGYTVRALNGAEAGYAHPKRIDTGRYRAGWVVAGERATGRRAGSARVSAESRYGGSNPAQAGDGDAFWRGAGLEQSVTVSNAVEYGPALEYGTATMQPGLHLTRGLLVAANSVAEAAGVEVPAAWEA